MTVRVSKKRNSGLGQTTRRILFPFDFFRKKSNEEKKTKVLASREKNAANAIQQSNKTEQPNYQTLVCLDTSV